MRYFEFDGIDYNLAQDTLQLPKLEFKIALEQFNHWFSECESLFYPDQIAQLSNALLRNFCRDNVIQDANSIFEDSDLSHDFEAYQFAHGFDAWQAQYQRWKQYAISPASKNNFYESEENPSYLIKLIPVWFDNQYKNSPERQLELKRMTYPDYLKTDHWGHVRALAIFTFKAMCIGKPCEWNVHEGMWFDYAQHRHTHHLSYKNRGNERFGDVCILCNECHEKLHKENANILDESSIDNWLNFQHLE